MISSPGVSTKEHVLGTPTLEGLAHYIKVHDVRRILVLVGAGASVAAGIPDFRSPGTGIYANLGKYSLKDPTDAFSLALLRKAPEIFYAIAQEMNLWPGHFQPTPVHYFIRLLEEEGRLLRCCTQNIDGLEKAAGVSEDRVVEAHGSFATASCIECHTPFSIQQNKLDAMGGVISRCHTCGGVVKPDVVFFGESLPDAFFDVLQFDAPTAELVVIIGTSLQVHPFASLPCVVPKAVPRVVINRERVGGFLFRFPDDPFYEVHDFTVEPEGSPQQTSGSASQSSEEVPDSERQHGSLSRDSFESGREVEAAVSPAASTSSSSDGYRQYGDYDTHPAVLRDVLFRGDCQENIMKLSEYLGFAETLTERMREGASPTGARP